MGNLPGAQLHTDGYDGQVAKIVVDEDRHVIVVTGW
jgi:hypothetical protein